MVLRAVAQGLLTTWVANQSTPCHRQFGYAMAADALANFDASSLDTAPFGAPVLGGGLLSSWNVCHLLSALYVAVIVPSLMVHRSFVVLMRFNGLPRCLQSAPFASAVVHAGTCDCVACAV